MAPSTKRAKERKAAKHAKRNRYSRRWCCDCHRTEARPRLRENIDLRELVWQLLNITKHNQGTRATWPLSRGRMQRERSERYLRLSPFESVSVSRANSESGAGTLENLTEAMDSAGSNSYVESIGPRSVDANRALLNKRSILQVINNYIKAGIEEGKRQAKMYIRKALCFGVKSGYLIPADSQGQVLKLSPTLTNSRGGIGRNLRKRRRPRARKLDDGVVKTAQRTAQKRNSFSRYFKRSRDESIESIGPRRNEPKSKRKKIVNGPRKNDKVKPTRRRPKKETRTGRIEKRTKRSNDRLSKDSSKRTRTSSKSSSKGNRSRKDLGYNDKSYTENEEKCRNKREVKDIPNEFIVCPIPEHRTSFLTDRENDSRNEPEEGEKSGNNEDRLVDDFVLKRTEG